VSSVAEAWVNAVTAEREQALGAGAGRVDVAANALWAAGVAIAAGIATAIIVGRCAAAPG
jgi:hypothetical protein